jgi:hypothetical protein
MRIESTMPSRDGGWYHFYDDTQKLRPLPLPPRQKASKAIDAPALAECCQLAIKPAQVEWLAMDLGVHGSALESLGLGWSKSHNAYTVPMSDGQGSIIGIHLRWMDGKKMAVTGSRNGLFIPDREPGGIVFLPEGMSNTASLLTMGIYAIGRPSCNTGGEMLKEYLKLIGAHRVVVVADNDELKSTGTRPGIEGANKLKKELGIKSIIFIPPSPLKDVRQLLNKAGPEKARAIINTTINQKIWTK